MLLKTLQIRFENQYLKQVYQIQLGAGIQRNGGELQEFDADVERLAFIDGIRNIEMQKAIRTGRRRKRFDTLWNLKQLRKAQRHNMRELEAVFKGEKLKDTNDRMGQLEEKFGKLSRRLISKENSRGNRSNDEWEFVSLTIPGSGSLLKGFWSRLPELGRGQYNSTAVA
ncbi:hypothetical protein Trydic_g9541 [Trypoxylus dichotomus]